MSKESKHDHKATKCLKTWIFALVMLAPFFAIGVKCLYVIKNENAKESYRGNYQFEQNIGLKDYLNITYKTDWVENSQNNYSYTNNVLGNTITHTFTYIQNNYDYYYVYGFNINSEIFNNMNNTNFNNSVKSIYIVNNSIDNKFGIVANNFSIDANTNILKGQNSGSYTLDKVYQPNDIINIIPNDNTIWTGESYNSRVNNTLNDFKILIYVNDNTLSSVFYSSIQELDKASIFSWTTDTGTYTAVNNMCTTLGIVSPPLAVLITYWTLISIIYIIIDIVLETLIYLTHWINDKMI